jgi:photosystem II S4 domain protein
MLPKDELLAGCQHLSALTALIDQAEQALRTWEPSWSGFLAPEVREEAEARLGTLSELELLADGGWPQAERCRLRLQRAEFSEQAHAPAALCGLVITGNFLFDPANPADVRAGLEAAGIAADQLGDIWMRGDRGAQAVITAEQGFTWQNRSALVRTVDVQLECVALTALQWPASRMPKQLSTVEASLRLDAVASAGLGLSRSRMAELIRAGAVRVNWQQVTSPSRELRSGDRIRLEGRGELEILEIQTTKRDRWRLLMQRR